MTSVNLDHYGDALMRNPDTWVWLVVAVLGVAACLRVIALFGADDWVSFAVMLVMCWIALGCLVDIGFTGAIAGHLTDLWYWEFAAFSAIWLVGSYWLVNRFIDTRASRLVAPRASHVFELDLPENVAYKEQRLRRIYGGLPENVALVPVDFEADDLNVALGAHGFNPQQRTVFVWEAVTQYLTEHGVLQTLACLSHAAAGQSAGLHLHPLKCFRREKWAC